MIKRKSVTKNIDPRVAAAAILIVLGIVQVVWWKGLVSMNRGRTGFAGPQNSAPARPDPSIAGMPGANVDTMAGAPDPGDRDGNGRDARFDSPSGLAADNRGGVFVADTRNNRIRYVAVDGVTQTVSGREAGYRDGAAEQALFNGPTGIAVTTGDQIFVADTLNHRIRRIQKGVVETIAGGEAGMVDGPGASARFNLPAGLSVADGGRKLYIADSGNKRIRVVSLGASGATVTTAAQTTSGPTSAQPAAGGIATTLPDEGALIIGSSRAKAVPITGGAAPAGTVTLRSPVAICPSSQGWYTADATHGAVLLVSHGSAQVVAGEAKASPSPKIGFLDGTGDKAMFGLVSGLATDSSGTLYVADATNNAIRRIRFGEAPKPEPEGGRNEWHPGEEYRAFAIRSSQGRDTGKMNGPAGPKYPVPNRR